MSKWLPFCRLYFQLHFIWEILLSILISLIFFAIFNQQEATIRSDIRLSSNRREYGLVYGIIHASLGPGVMDKFMCVLVDYNAVTKQTGFWYNICWCITHIVGHCNVNKPSFVWRMYLAITGCFYDLVHIGCFAPLLSRNKYLICNITCMRTTRASCTNAPHLHWLIITSISVGQNSSATHKLQCWSSMVTRELPIELQTCRLMLSSVLWMT